MLGQVLVPKDYCIKNVVNLKEGLQTHVQELHDIPAETRDCSAGRQEREDIVGAIATTVQVPGMPCNVDIAGSGLGCAVGVVDGGNRAGVEVSKPNHDFILAGAS